MRMYSESDVDTSCLEGKRIAILGYGSQGRAHGPKPRQTDCI
jgi:ketol-acid reductoisomerase